MFSDRLPCDRVSKIRKHNNDAVTVFRHKTVHGPGFHGMQKELRFPYVRTVF